MNSLRERGGESLDVGENVTNCCVVIKRINKRQKGIHRDKEAHKITCFIAQERCTICRRSLHELLLKSRSQPKKRFPKSFHENFLMFHVFSLLLSLLSHVGRQHSTNVYQWKERRRRTSVLCIENSQSVFFIWDGRREVARIINK